MKVRERFHKNLNFEPVDRSFFTETFPSQYWDKTLDRWHTEGLPKDINLISHFGFDPLYSVFINYSPQPEYERKILEDHKEIVKPIVSNMKEWNEYSNRLKPSSERIKWQNYDKNLLEIKEEQKRDNCVIRLVLYGFFWFPRTLLGIEEHLMAFYDKPDLMNNMNEFVLGFNETMIDLVSREVKIDCIMINEDLSYRSGPMLSPEMFDKFLLPFYKRFTSYIHDKGIPFVIVDTDGNFEALIPNFIEGGVNGFIPMEVQTGMDVRKIRENYPNLKLFGGIDKMKLFEGRRQIDKELERVKPVIKKGEYISGCDHQVPPQVSLADYKYYLAELRKIL
ncbi:MAG: uroporphyrinogen decarboxylase family protein [bacterium]